MATEADLELAQILKSMVDSTHQNILSVRDIVKDIHKEAEANRKTALSIAQANANVKQRSRISGEDKAAVCFAALAALVVLGITGVIGFNGYINNQNDAKVQVACTQSGGTWGTRGGDDNANKYDRLCLRGNK